MTVRASLIVATVLAFAVGCAETDPKSPSTWIAKLEATDAKVVADAARELRNLKAKEAVAPLTGLLKHEDASVRDEAAYALGEIGDASAIDKLADAIDLAGSKKGSDRVNKRIAESLAKIGDKRATPVLSKLLENARDPLVKAAAASSLGKLKDPAAIPVLLKFAEPDGIEPLVRKNAIVALGEIGGTDGIAGLIRGMYIEERGASFFPEASWSLFQIGTPATEAVAKVIVGEDKAFLTWAESKGRVPAAWISKSAIVLGDSGNGAYGATLAEFAGWKHPDGDTVQEYTVRAVIADALGRLRAKEGVAPLTAQLAIPEANVRESVAVALALIGDKAAVAKLEAAAKNMKDSWSARQAAMRGLALLGDAKSKGVFEANQKNEEGDKAFKNCMAEDSGMEHEAMKQARCEKEKELRPKFLTEELARLMAGDACQADAACWAGKLKDPVGKVRERAAFELGKLGDASAVDALVAACKDESLDVRRASYIALDWLTRVDAAKGALKGKLAVIQQQIEDETGKAYYVKVNEDLKRAAAKIARL